jgi:hypothetical protein
LMVKKSNFTSLSQNHVEKKARLALKNETEWFEILQIIFIFEEKKIKVKNLHHE